MALSLPKVLQNQHQINLFYRIFTYKMEQKRKGIEERKVAIQDMICNINNYISFFLFLKNESNYAYEESLL